VSAPEEVESNREGEADEDDIADKVEAMEKARIAEVDRVNRKRLVVISVVSRTFITRYAVKSLLFLRAQRFAPGKRLHIICQGLSYRYR